VVDTQAKICDNPTYDLETDTNSKTMKILTYKTFRYFVSCADKTQNGCEELEDCFFKRYKSTSLNRETKAVIMKTNHQNSVGLHEHFHIGPWLSWAYWRLYNGGVRLAEGARMSAYYFSKPPSRKAGKRWRSRYGGLPYDGETWGDVNYTLRVALYVHHRVHYELDSTITNLCPREGR